MSVVYEGKDLEAMSFAINYHKWILNDFRPFLGRDIVEVGAGTGGFSDLLLSEKPRSLTLVEPSEMFTQLRQNIESDGVSLKFYQNIFARVCKEIAADNRPDTIIYINVLEHIEDDLNELRLVYDCLMPGGKALIFVPALPRLYGEFDRQIGHFRRYVKNELARKAEKAGFSILMGKYFDFVGILPWFVKYKVLRSDSLESGAIKLYDTLAVPINRMLESLVSPPLGKNLLFVLEKPSE
jgi:SAM-dependent methyltransferase